VDALIEGLERRFQPLFDDLDCQLAAVFHPKFRMTWIELHDPSMVAGIKSAMEKVVERAHLESREGTVSSSSNSDADVGADENDFFME